MSDCEGANMRWLPWAKDIDHKGIARAAYNEKRYYDAEPHLKKILSKNKRDVWANEVLSRLYMNTDRHDKAIPLCKTILAQQKDAKLVRRILDCALICGKIKLAKNSIAQIELDIEDENRLLLVVNSLSDIQEREVFLEKLVVQYPGMDFILRISIEQLLKSGKRKIALKKIADLQSSQNLSFEMKLLFARVKFASGEREEAAVIFSWILDNIPTHLGGKVSLAKQFFYMGSYENSLSLCEMILQENPTHQYILDQASKILSESNRHEKALNLLILYCENYEVSKKIAKRYLRCALKCSNVEEIVNGMRFFEHCEINDLSMIQQATSKLLELKEFEVLEIALNLLDEDTVFTTRITASKLRAMGKTEEAIKYLEESQLDDVNITYHIAKLYSYLGNLEQVILLCDRILEKIPTHYSTTILKLQSGLKLVSIEEIEGQINESIEAFPSKIQLYKMMINLQYSGKFNYSEALQYCDKALRIAPNDRLLMSTRAQSLSKMNYHHEAIIATDELVFRHPNSVEAYLTKAQILKANGNGQGMINIINQMLELFQLHPIYSSHENNICVQYLRCDAPISQVSESKVTVIMTMYKKDPLIDAAIDSILNQTHRNIELIVVDDNSPDDAYEYVVAKEKLDPRLRTFKMKENGGTYLAKNFGLTKATGVYVTFMDSDDWTHPQRIERQLAKLDSNPDSVAVIHDNFRIDENSNIEYRGNGAVRMACISLLLKRSAQQELGFFDSLRVGADTEFIERINAVFGDGALIKDNLPTMFMMRHSSSLTGGGKFHISWRSIDGYRLAHHSSFREWHNKVRNKQLNGYVPRVIRVRKFDAPIEMFAGKTQWREGFPRWSEMIQQRHENWWTLKKEIWQKYLSAKLSGQEYVEQLGLKVPSLFWKGEVSEIPNFETFPSKFVLKPEEGWNAKNVWCLTDGYNSLDQQSYTRDDIIQNLENDEFVKSKNPTIMVEELLIPEEKSSQDGIPRDFKFYTFGEKIAMVHIVHRNSVVDTKLNVNHYLDSEFNPIKEKIMGAKKIPTDAIELPDCWDEMVEAVKIIGASLGIYMRIDMYATDKGAVFGEFTPTPHGGRGYTEWAERYLGSFWKGEEGCEDG